eukprot:7917860-Pyramimonas_sp.AAC.1
MTGVVVLVRMFAASFDCRAALGRAESAAPRHWDASVHRNFQVRHATRKPLGLRAPWPNDQ